MTEMSELANALEKQSRLSILGSDTKILLAEAAVALRSSASAEPVAWPLRPTEAMLKRAASHHNRSFAELSSIWDDFMAAAPSAPTVAPASVREALFRELGEPDHKLDRWTHGAQPFEMWSRESIDRAFAALSPAPTAAPTSVREDRTFYENASREYLVEQAIGLTSALEEARQEVGRLAALSPAQPARKEKM